MSKKLSTLGEFGLIQALQPLVRSSNKAIVQGIGDDAAVLSLTKDKFLLLTTDMLVEDVHFIKKMSAEAVGYKAMACNISDIAAMGGFPKYAVVSLGISGKTDLSWVKKIYAGMKKAADKFGCVIVGGDTVKSDKAVINVALTGEAFKKDVVLRSGAKVGDKIFTTGPLGNSFKSGGHLKFTPRVAEAQYLVKRFKPSAMIDISDGLAGDLNHILEESHVGAALWADQIPRRKDALLQQALYDGEDYELLFTLSAIKAEALMKTKDKKLRFYCVGEIKEKKFGIQLMTIEGRHQKIAGKSYTHF